MRDLTMLMLAEEPFNEPVSDAAQRKIDTLTAEVGQLKARNRKLEERIGTLCRMFNHIALHPEILHTMKIDITGNPGTNNTFQEIHIGTVQNYNPHATTVINHNYGDTRKPATLPTASIEGDTAEKSRYTADILGYVGHLKPYVHPEWQSGYESLWQSILAAPDIASVIFNPGKQKGTTFNRGLVANIIRLLMDRHVIAESNVTTLTKALEGDKDHTVRGYLGSRPDSQAVNKSVMEQIDRMDTQNTSKK